MVYFYQSAVYIGHMERQLYFGMHVTVWMRLISCHMCCDLEHVNNTVVHSLHSV